MRSSSLHGAASRNSKGIGATAAAVPNNPCCPDSRIREARCNAAMASSTDASIDSRGPSESRAPDLIRLSKTRLFRKRDSMCSQKSYSDLNSPWFIRDSRIALAVFSPTFLMAARPKRIDSPTGVKYSSLSFTSGGKFFHQIEDAFRLLLRNLVGSASRHKLCALRGHLLFLFLAHRAAKNVRLAKRKTCQAIGDLHDLFLI